MPAWHHHRRVVVGCLLLGNGTDKDGMEVIRRRQGDFNLRNENEYGQHKSVKALQVAHAELSILSASPS